MDGQTHTICVCLSIHVSVEVLISPGLTEFLVPVAALSCPSRGPPHLACYNSTPLVPSLEPTPSRGPFAQLSVATGRDPTLISPSFVIGNQIGYIDAEEWPLCPKLMSWGFFLFPPGSRRTTELPRESFRCSWSSL